MNIQQMTKAIKSFRAADVSVIKDEKLRAKAHKLQAKQGGFTLLELLVVITLLATLATGALVAYEGIGDQAEAAAGAKNASTLDSSIRNYRAVEREYPNQWDSLVTNNTTSGGLALSTLATSTQGFLGSLALVGTTTSGVFNNADTQAIVDALVSAGIEEVQSIPDDVNDGVSPNLAHNESTPLSNAIEVELEDAVAPSHISVVPVAVNASTACPALPAGGAIPTSTLGGTAVIDNSILNRYADALEGDECHLVVALGFGGDAAASTVFSNVAISQSPTYINNNPDDAANNINPSEHYSRYIGLFHIAELEDTDATDGPSAGDTWEFREKARLVALIAPDGKNVDQLVANAQQQ